MCDLFSLNTLTPISNTSMKGWVFMFINRCRKIVAMVGIVAFSIMFSSLASTKARSQKSDEILSPSGLALLQESMKDYPAFDEKKVKADAEEKYKLAKVGDQVTVKYRKGQISGLLRELDKKSIRVGDTKIVFIDMDPEEDARFIEDKCKILRNKYVRGQQNIYEAQLKESIYKNRKELEPKYPAIGKKTLADLFSKMKDKTLRSTLSAEFADAYDKSLPLEGARRALIAKTAEKFAADKNISFDGEYFRTIAEMEEEKAQAEAKARRTEELRNLVAQRAEDRFLLPKTASPTFKPDGGLYTPGQKVELYCSTPDATINYTTDGKEPTEDSTVYTGPITVRNAHVVIKAKAFHPFYNDSETAVSARFQEAGSGLYASYFNTSDCTGKALTRLDKTVDFDWGGGSPDHAIPDDYFSGIWAGSITPKSTGIYKFYLSIDNGGRLWIGDTLIIDHWIEDVTTQTAEIRLVGGTRYDIKIAYCEVWGGAYIKLQWSSPTVPKEIVPKNCLYPEGKYVNELTDWNQLEKGIYMNRPNMTNPCSNGKTTVVKLVYALPKGMDRLENHINK